MRYHPIQQVRHNLGPLHVLYNWSLPVKSLSRLKFLRCIFSAVALRLRMLCINLWLHTSALFNASTPHFPPIALFQFCLTVRITPALLVLETSLGTSSSSSSSTTSAYFARGFTNPTRLCPVGRTTARQKSINSISRFTESNINIDRFWINLLQLCCHDGWRARCPGDAGRLT